MAEEGVYRPGIQANPWKYMVFNRDELDKTLNDDGLFSILEQISLEDSVVIRRQDSFASPCLLTYANMIEIVAKNHPDRTIGRELQAIADYFHEQGVLAGEEGHQLPTL